MTDKKKTAPHYAYCGSRPWSVEGFKKVAGENPGKWSFAADPEQLAGMAADHPEIEMIFFSHWSWKVPSDILRRHECVCFHMTDVPFGRGGSPLQNLIASGKRSTVMTALRMVEEIDAGPVYLKEPMSLEGAAEEIYLRAAALIARMIARIVRERPEPSPQEGPAVLFARRSPKDSELPRRAALFELHDHIRMLDAEGYPKAFFVKDGYRYEFSRSALKTGKIVADVEITPVEES